MTQRNTSGQSSQSAQLSQPQRIPAAVLGATGMVGQRLVALLAEHPWFALVGVAASDRSQGRPYGDVVRWRIEGDVPAQVRSLPLVAPTPGAHLPAQVVFSALPTAEAQEFEPAFARAGAFVSSNASAYRMSDHPASGACLAGRARHQPQLLNHWPDHRARSPGAFRAAARHRHHVAGSLRRGLSRRAFARSDR